MLFICLFSMDRSSSNTSPPPFESTVGYGDPGRSTMWPDNMSFLQQPAVLGELTLS